MMVELGPVAAFSFGVFCVTLLSCAYLRWRLPEGFLDRLVDDELERRERERRNEK